MSKSRKILTKILSGRSDANISFSDLCHLLERAGFTRKLGKSPATKIHGVRQNAGLIRRFFSL